MYGSKLCTVLCTLLFHLKYLGVHSTSVHKNLPHSVLQLQSVLLSGYHNLLNKFLLIHICFHFLI